MGRDYIGRAFARLALPIVLLSAASGAIPAASQTGTAAAQCALGRRSPDIAIAACSALLAQGVPNARASAYHNRGTAYAAKGDVDRAIADVTAGIEIDSQSAFRFQERGELYTRKREFERALADLDQAIRIDRVPRAFRHHSRAVAWREKGNLRRALLDFDRAIQIDQTPRAFRFNDRANVLRQLGDYARALADLEVAMRIEPQSGYLWVERALTHGLMGQLPQADADLAEAARKEPSNQELALSIGRARERIAAASAGPTIQAARPPEPTNVPAPTRQGGSGEGSKVALVIGVGAYRNASPLLNPVNDASDVAAALRELGFDVLEGRDLDTGALRSTAAEFARKVDRAQLALFFYAGHSIQVDGRNYLLPTDASLSSPADLHFGPVDLQQVLNAMESEDRVSVVILDACRDNPFAQKLRASSGARSTSIGRGLAPIEIATRPSRSGRPSGTLVAFATQPGNTAEDGGGRNSPFTKALLTHIRTPGLELEALMRRVRGDVVASTAGRQVPRLDSGIIGDVLLRTDAPH